MGPARSLHPLPTRRNLCSWLRATKTNQSCSCRSRGRDAKQCDVRRTWPHLCKQKEGKEGYLEPASQPRGLARIKVACQAGPDRESGVPCCESPSRIANPSWARQCWGSAQQSWKWATSWDGSWLPCSCQCPSLAVQGSDGPRLCRPARAASAAVAERSHARGHGAHELERGWGRARNESP